MTDRVSERFVSHGFDCVIGRGGPSNENFNGYMRIPAGHPWHGKDYGDIACEVHGGLTFGDWCLPWEQSGDEYWIGFDTCHAGDLVIGLSPFAASFAGDVFRDEEYVREELISMAERAHEADSKATQARNN